MVAATATTYPNPDAHALSFRNAKMLVLVAVSAVLFLVFGGYAIAPYWLFDGASFLVSATLGYKATVWLATAQLQCVHLGSAEAACVLAKRYATATCCVAGLSVVCEIGFLGAAIMLYDEEMNPVARVRLQRPTTLYPTPMFCPTL